MDTPLNLVGSRVQPVFLKVDLKVALREGEILNQGSRYGNEKLAITYMNTFGTIDLDSGKLRRSRPPRTIWLYSIQHRPSVSRLAIGTSRKVYLSLVRSLAR
jgi:hypothetical protein